MKKNHIIFVIGKAQSGKTTFGQALAEGINAIRCDASFMVLHQYHLLTGCRIEDEADKIKRRRELSKIGDLICSRSPPRLVDLILDENVDLGSMVITGVRRQKEFLLAAASAQRRGYEVFTVRITRPDMPDVEDSYEPEMEDMPVNSDICNAGSLDSLLDLADQVAMVLKGQRAGAANA